MLRTEDPMLHIFDNLNNQQQIYRANIIINNKKGIVDFRVKPRSKYVNIAFYLYKDDKRIDIQWYSKEFSYTLDKQKHSKGRYKIRYFIVDENIKNPGKEKKIEQGFSEYIELY